MSVIRFQYSFPYENALAALKGVRLTDKQHLLAEQKVRLVQRIWNRHDASTIQLFERILKIEIDEVEIKVWLSFVSQSSFSDPLTVSVPKSPSIQGNIELQRALISTVIHE